MNSDIISIDRLVEGALDKVLGLTVYETIMTRFKQCDVSRDETFRKTFTYYYKVRRPTEWLDRYYAFFEQAKKVDDLTFADIISELGRFDRSKRSIEISFASKMYHTLHPDMPIYDQFVAKNIGLEKLPNSGCYEDRLVRAIEIYGDLVKKSKELLANRKVIDEIVLFDKVLPMFSWAAPMKKLDFLLWANQNIVK